MDNGKTFHDNLIKMIRDDNEDAIDREIEALEELCFTKERMEECRERDRRVSVLKKERKRIARNHIML